MYRIGKTWRFEAAHQLGGLPPTHPCARIHGHSYVVDVEIEPADGRHPLNQAGFIVDFGDLRPLGEFVATRLDHRLLNDVVAANPTAENLARFLWDQWHYIIDRLGGHLAVVRVHETATAWAEYRATR